MSNLLNKIPDISNNAIAPTPEQVYKNYYGVFKDGIYGNVNFAGLGLLSNPDNFVNNMIEDFKQGLSTLIQVEEYKERLYLNALYKKLEPSIMNNSLKMELKAFLDSAANTIGENNLKTDNFSAALNILTAIQLDSVQQYQTFTTWYNDYALKMGDSYNSTQWLTVVNQVLESCDWSQTKIQDLESKISSAIINTFWDQKDAYFKPTALEYAKQIVNALPAKLGTKDTPLTLASMLNDIPTGKSSFVNTFRTREGGKHKNYSITQVVEDYVMGAFGGKSLELYVEFALGQINTGNTKKNMRQLNNTYLKSKNIAADNIAILSLDLQRDQSIEKRISTSQTLEEIRAIESEFDKESYFRIENSAKSYSSKNQSKVKLKDPSSFNAHLRQLEDMGKVLNLEDEAHALIFKIINGAPGFCYEHNAHIEDAIAALSFAYMFDVEEMDTVREFQEIANNANSITTPLTGRNQIHIYSIGGNYFMASDILKVLLDALSNSRKTNPIDIALDYKDININELKTQIKPYTGIDRWNYVKNAILTKGKLSPHFKWSTVKAMMLDRAKLLNIQ